MAIPQSWAVVSYGALAFELRGTRSIRQEAILDARGNYKFTKWTIEFSSTLNPSATSYSPSVINGEGDPIQVANQFPAATSAAIREYLLQPRRTLIYRNGRTVLLQCPVQGGAVDSEAGPTVETCSVIAEHGSRTFVVAMRITCSVNEGWRKNALLSHTWQTKAHYDQDWQPIIVTRGIAVFDANVVQQLGTFPDGCRSSFLHPVPPNCRRETVDITAEEDGNTVSYEIVDRWTDFTIDVSGVQRGNGPGGVFGYPSRFEAIITAGYKARGSDEAEAEERRSFVDSVLGFVERGTYFGSGLTGELTGRIAGIARARMHAATSQVPVYDWRMVVKCWGNAYSNRWDMICWACAMIASRFPLIDQTYSTSFHVTEMLHTRYIEVEMMQSKPASTLVYGGAAVNSFINNQLPGPVADFFRNNVGAIFGLGGVGPENGLEWTLGNFSVAAVNETVNGLTPPVNGIANFGGVNASIVKDSTKGARMATPEVTRPPMILGRVNFFGKIVAQALAEPCQLPPQVSANWPITPATDVQLY